MNEMAKQNDKHVASYENGLPRIGGYRARDAYREELKRQSTKRALDEERKREDERRKRETEERNRRSSENLHRQNQMLVTMCCIL